MPNRTVNQAKNLSLCGSDEPTSPGFPLPFGAILATIEHDGLSGKEIRPPIRA
jgi:hypothetical protein